MNHLNIKRLRNARSKEWEQALDQQGTTVTLDQINWSDFPYKPEVKCKIAHAGSHLLLKFLVQEKNIRGVEVNANGPVHKDSCVEFFISPQGDGNYYNFEFNCIGTPHVGYGEGRHNRQHLPVEVVKTIAVRSTLGTEPIEHKQGDFSWELFVSIPVNCFIYDDLENFDKLEAYGNFYKCGDELAEPHFVTWSPVETETPDYHQYEYFGKLKFE